MRHLRGDLCQVFFLENLFEQGQEGSHWLFFLPSQEEAACIFT